MRLSPVPVALVAAITLLACVFASTESNLVSSSVQSQRPSSLDLSGTNAERSLLAKEIAPPAANSEERGPNVEAVENMAKSVNPSFWQRIKNFFKRMFAWFHKPKPKTEATKDSTKSVAKTTEGATTNEKNVAENTKPKEESPKAKAEETETKVTPPKPARESGEQAKRTETEGDLADNVNLRYNEPVPGHGTTNSKVVITELPDAEAAVPAKLSKEAKGKAVVTAKEAGLPESTINTKKSIANVVDEEPVTPTNVGEEANVLARVHPHNDEAGPSNAEIVLNPGSPRQPAALDNVFEPGKHYNPFIENFGFPAEDTTPKALTHSSPRRNGIKISEVENVEHPLNLAPEADRNVLTPRAGTNNAAGGITRKLRSEY